MKSIFSYMDYRKWIVDLLDYKKQINPTLSLRLFAKEANIDTSLLSKVIAEKRHLGKHSIVSLAKYLKLSQNEIKYLNCLLIINKSSNKEDKSKAYEEAINLRTIDQEIILEDQHIFYSEWHHSALRNLLQVYKFNGTNFRELGLQLNPPISADDARKSISLLLRLGLIKKNKNGTYKLSNMAVSTGDKWSGLAIKNYHKQNIKLGLEAIDRHPQEDRDISGLTMNISNKDLAVIREKIKDFRQDLIQYINNNADPKSVYHLNLQLFPFSKLEGSHE